MENGSTAVPTLITNSRKRNARILRLFFSLFLGFLLQYLKARLTFHSYDFFADARRNRQRAIKIRNAAVEMGGVLIKVGQFLSSRVDLLPAEYIEELALLQDEVPGVPFVEIRAEIEGTFGLALDRLFAEIDPVPVAAASLGQVHRAILPTGEVAAIKVRRPHIEAIVEADLKSFRTIIRWLDRFSAVRNRVDLPQILQEFEETLRLELDYQREGHHAERIATIFAGTPEIAVPRVYWSHSKGTVLAMQFMWGDKVTDFDRLEQAGISRAETAEILMRAYLKQVIEVGFFHADPHPGNILVRPGPVVVFLDFGMVGNISPQMTANIRRVFLGIVQRDFDEVLNALARLGFIPPNADRKVLKRALVWTVNTFYEMSFAELQAVDPRDVLDRLQDVFYTESFRIPANFAFLGRALGTLSGLCTALDPSFQFVTVAEPFARRLLTRGRGIGALAGTLGGEVRDVVLAAYALPRLGREALERASEDELEVRQELQQVVTAVHFVERAVRRVLYAVLVAALLLTGAYLLRTHLLTLAVGAFILAVIFFGGVLFPFPLRRRRRF